MEPIVAASFRAGMQTDTLSWRPAGEGFGDEVGVVERGTRRHSPIIPWGAEVSDKPRVSLVTESV